MSVATMSSDVLVLSIVVQRGKGAGRESVFDTVIRCDLNTSKAQRDGLIATWLDLMEKAFGLAPPREENEE